MATEKIDQVLADIDDFLNEVTGAYDQAGVDCRAGGNKDTVLGDLEAKLVAAKSNFEADKANFQIGADLEPLLKQHQADQEALLKAFADNIRAEGQILTDKWRAAAGG